MGKDRISNGVTMGFTRARGFTGEMSLRFYVTELGVSNFLEFGVTAAGAFWSHLITTIN